MRCRTRKQQNMAAGTTEQGVKFCFRKARTIRKSKTLEYHNGCHLPYCSNPDGENSTQ